MRFSPMVIAVMTIAMGAQPASASLHINEILASNADGLTDGFGEHSDWIEIHNRGPAPVDLAGYHLSDEPDFLTKWSFPSVTIPADGYLVLFASGRDQADGSGFLHTSFKLDKDGEYLALVRPDGVTLEDQFSPEYPEQFTDISYGRDPSAAGVMRFFSDPTPGAVNGSGYGGVVKDTKFSVDRGFYDEPVSVVITSATPGAAIRYTLDGTAPSESTGLVYSGAITISNTVPLRAMAYRADWLPTDVDTHTYIFVDQVARQPSDPAGWPSDWGDNWGNWGDENLVPPGQIIPADYEMDPRVVNQTIAGYSIRDALLDIPTVSISMLPADFIDQDTGIYPNSMERWERGCSVEYIQPDGSEGFQHDCKVEVHGNSSRRPYRMQKHSLRLTFTREYGPAKLRFPLFADSPVDSFNQLVLRACFTDSWGLVSWAAGRYRPNDSLYVRDVWMKDSLRAMGQPSSHGHFVHLYVNGLYFGVHNLTERLADDFMADHLGGDPEDWELNEDFGSPKTRWNEMRSIDPSTTSGYAQIQNYLDIDNFCDYMLLHFYADSEDWPSHNGYAAANPVSGDGRFRFFVWDQEIVLDRHGLAWSRIDSGSGVGALFQDLRANPEFRLRFADRVYAHCFHDGALSESASQQRFVDTAMQIDKAIVAESARWGDTQMSTPYGNSIDQPSPLDDINDPHYPPAPHGPDYYFTREASWLVELDNVVSNYIPAIHDQTQSDAIINVLRAKNLYPDIDPPAFNQHGGEVSSAFGLLMSAGAGVIWYTLDGSDPRLPGGGVNPEALAFSGAAIYFTENPVTVKARAVSGSEWSALHEATFYVDTERARAGNLVISEIHYNPPGSDDYEFLELHNIGNARISLEGVQLAAGVDYTFGNVMLETGAYVVVVKNASAFSNRYQDASSPWYSASVSVAGVWDGQLANDGERILLRTGDGEVIQDFSYSDGGAWPGRADARGSSLERFHAAVPPGYPEHWRASIAYHGTPGRAPDPESIVINEIMSHSDTGSDWVELLNTGAAPVDISGYYLSDDLDQPFKYRIPAQAPVAPGAFVVIDQAAFDTGVHAFAFSELGEEVSLVEAQGTNIIRVVAYEDFGAADPDRPFGRHIRRDGLSAFTALASATPLATNAPPLIGPVVIGEIMYHPPDGKLEYVELVNITTAPVDLFSGTNGWKLTSAVTYPFPPGVTLPAGGRLVVTEGDPATFRALYAVPEEVPVFGPWDGALDNDGESVRLRKPGAPEPDGTVPMIVADRVDYRDYAPWPLAADGSGASLERLDFRAFGSDPYTWYASETSRGTPGTGQNPINSTPNQYPAITDPGTLHVDEETLLSAQILATDPDIGQVLYFELMDEVPAGCSITPDGLLTWSPTEEDGPGNVLVRVKVTDSGIPNLSATRLISIVVNEVNTPPTLLSGSTGSSTNQVFLVPFGAIWRYLDDGSDPGTAWRSPSFDDAAWPSGPARLGYGDPAATTVSYGPNASDKYPTTYFRHTFSIDGVSIAEQLRVDFSRVGGPAPPGWTSYTATHEQLPSFQAQSFDAFGSTVTVTPAWAATAVDEAAQMIDRGDNGAADADLLRDWIGTDARVAGNPLSLTLSGLPPGTYSWVSYHHDNMDQTGVFDVTVVDGAGSARTTGVDISSGDLPLAFVTTFQTQIQSDGGDVILVFNKSPGGVVAEAFFVMNGFLLTRQQEAAESTLSSLVLNLVRDDGAIVYLNGNEIVRDNMPAGTVTYLTYAVDGVGGADETTPHPFTFDAAYLQDGLNTLAVEVHQHSPNSSDLGFDLALAGESVSSNPTGLTNYVTRAGQEVRFICESTDADRPLQAIRYSLAPGSPPGASIDPLSGLFSWTPTDADGPAVVTLTVVATDDGIPPLSDTRSFDVTVYAPITSGDVVFTNGVVTWRTIPGETYRVEHCQDLLTDTWTPIHTQTAEGAYSMFMDPLFLVLDRGFYRILPVDPPQ